MDIFLGIDHLPFKATAKAALLIAKICITSPSYEAETKNLYDAYDIKISKSEAWEITEYVGDIVLTNELQLVAADLQAYDVSKARIARPGRRPKDGFALYVMPDGSMYNTKPNTRNMSPATDEEDTQTIESEQPAKGTNISTWQELKLAVVFRSDDLIKTSEVNKHGLPVMRIGKREYVGTIKPIDHFRNRLLHVLIKNGLMDASDVVFIGDGAKWIQNTRKRFINNKGTGVLDLYHLKENTMEFAKYIFHNNETQYMPWWKNVCQMLEDGRWKDVLALPEVALYKTRQTPAGTVNLHKYIYENREYINYPHYMAKGYFVGSGAIESGNKTVPQERMKLAGMKWRPSCAERMLILRTKYKSNLWDEEVVPLVLTKYSKHHLAENSIRTAQRKSHKK